jgi:hypothetical protein
MVEDNKAGSTPDSQNKNNNILGFLRVYLPVLISDSFGQVLLEIVSLRDKLYARQKDLR